MTIATTWGSDPDERAMPFPCDPLLADADADLYRAVDVHASPSTTFRWLCQLRVAPYSYDWIDNGGRASPRALTPGADELVNGQTMMTIFDLADFEKDRHLTMVLKPRATRAFGKIVVSYVVVPAPRGSRVIVKMRVASPRGVIGRIRTWLLGWGDLVMMRKQLLTLKACAEAEAPGSRDPHPG